MAIIKSLEAFGDYCMLMWRSIGVPERGREFFKRYLNEMEKLGIDSIPLTRIEPISLAMLEPILPDRMRQRMVDENSSKMISRVE